MSFHLLSIEWNLIRPGGPAHGIVTKTVHKTLPGGGGWWCSPRGGWVCLGRGGVGPRGGWYWGVGVVGVQGMVEVQGQ